MMSEAIRPGYLRVTEVLSKHADFSRVKPEVLEAAAERGTIIHGICEAILKGRQVEVPAWAEPTVEGFQRWRQSVVSEVGPVESRLYDDEWMITGQIDLLARLRGDSKWSVIDLKSPKTVGTTWRAQLAAYWRLATVNGYEVGRVMTLRLGLAKPKADDSTATLELDLAGFKSALAAHRYFASLKGGAKEDPMIDAGPEAADIDFDAFDPSGFAAPEAVSETRSEPRSEPEAGSNTDVYADVIIEPITDADVKAASEAGSITDVVPDVVIPITDADVKAASEAGSITDVVPDVITDVVTDDISYAPPAPKKRARKPKAASVLIAAPVELGPPPPSLPAAIEAQTPLAIAVLERMRGEAEGLRAKVDALNVTDRPSYEAAAGLLIPVKKTINAIEAARKAQVDDAWNFYKKVNAFAKSLSAPLEDSKRALEGKMRAHDDRERAAAREAERLRALSAEDALAAPPAEAAPPRTVHTGDGSLTAIVKWTFEVEDPGLVPREFLKVDETLIRAAVSGGVRNIPGVRIYEAASYRAVG